MLTLRRVRTLALALFPLLAALAPANAHADGKIAVVDIRQALMQTEDGIRAQATLKKQFDRLQKELDAMQDDLQKAREEIVRQQAVLSNEAFNRRGADWQRRMLELQTRFVDHNRALQKKEAELTAPIMKKLFGVIARIANKKGYDIIFDRQATGYVRPDLDLTEQVIQMYNSGDAGDSAPEAGGDKAASPGEEKK